MALDATGMDRPRILAVEDEPIVAMDLDRSLVELGYEVVGVAASGPKAISLAEQLQPDLVLMDIQLRGPWDGIAAADQIRDQWQIPVVFVTANANDETVARAKAAGPYGYLTKPFRLSELNATIRIALHQHGIVRELFTEHGWFRTLLESINDGVIATDINGRVRFLNSAGESLTGWTECEATGKPFFEIYPLTTLNGQPVLEFQLERALTLATPTAKQRFDLRTREGFGVPIEASAAPIIQRGSVAGAVAVFRDITSVLREEREARERGDRLEEEVEATTQALGQTRSELRALSAHLMNAQETERRRIARDLHDDFGQRTVLLDMNMDRLSTLLPARGKAAHLLETIRKQMVALSDGLRQMSHSLHPSVLTDLGLVPGLQNLVEDFRTGGMDVCLHAKKLSTQPSIELSTTLYRIAQEALKNAAKHAANSSVHVKLSQRNHEIQLSIEDSGPGFDLDAHARNGIGLLSIQERARQLGGSFALRSAPGEGTYILVRVPVPETKQQNS